MIRNLTDMDQTVYTGQNLGECAKAHQLHDLDLSRIADRIAIGEHGPGVRIRILVAERDLSLLTVKVNDIDIDLITDGNDLGRLMDAAPAEF